VRGNESGWRKDYSTFILLYYSTFCRAKIDYFLMGKVLRRNGKHKDACDKSPVHVGPCAIGV
jgi:hypothetical protein